jgi:hypothetical protein
MDENQVFWFKSGIVKRRVDLEYFTNGKSLDVVQCAFLEKSFGGWKLLTRLLHLVLPRR